MALRTTKTAFLILGCAALILVLILLEGGHNAETVANFVSSSRVRTLVSSEKSDLLQHVREKCGQLGMDTLRNETQGPGLYTQFLVEDNYKLLYCYVPKVACSNWQRVLLALSGKVNTTNPADISVYSVYHQFRHLLRTLSSYKTDFVHPRLKHYFTFMFVRHPLERLLSAWRNKFESSLPPSVTYRRRYVKEIVRTYRNRNDSLQLDNHDHLDNVHIRFDEFLRYVVDEAEKGKALNEHWERFHKLCHPCKVRFDFVGRYENLQEDAARVLESVHADPRVSFPERSSTSKHSRTLEVMREHYKDIPAPLLKRVYRNFQTDFELFDYSLPDFLQESVNAE